MTSSYYPAPAQARTSWRDSSFIRIAGSAVSWFVFSLSFILLFQVSTSVLALGGYCASGGAYEIAVQCPDSVSFFAPLSVFMGLAGVFLGVYLSQGFGTPLQTWAWPILFCGLGSAFLYAFFASGDLTGLIIGAMFEVMGVIPLIIEFRGSWQRPFLGIRNLGGNRFYEGERARRSMLSPGTPNPEGSLPATAGDWLLAVVITVVSAFLGYWVAGLWFAAVVAAG
jgi:hypothetical protein